MPEAANLTPTIVDTLYEEALELADEARIALDRAQASIRSNNDLARVALSCETLRTTTRVMHALAWLLNQRAYYAGELSELQLERHGRLPPSQPDPDPAQLALLPAALVELIERTLHFYERIERLDRIRRERSVARPPVHLLRERLTRSVARL